MIQGGNPNHNGTGGSEKQIIGEFSENGINNPLSHDRGVISMARASYSMDSASSQFFICDSGNYKGSRDGKYASFGWVTEGMDVVDAIAAAAQHLTEIRKLQENARNESAKHASQLEKLTVTLDRTRQDYQQETAKLSRELEANKKAADAALQAMKKDESTRREAEIAELRRTFAAGQQALLKQYESEKAARIEAEAKRSNAESQLNVLRKEKEQLEQKAASLPAPAETSANPVPEKKGESHD